MSAEPSEFGWQLLYSIYKEQFTSKSNVLVVWSHFTLIRRGFKSIGMGEDPTTVPNPLVLTETLPFGWNDNLPMCLRYYHNKRIHILSIQKPDEDGDMIMTFYRPSDNRSCITCMNVCEIEQLSGTLNEIMPDWHAYLRRMTDDIIEPILAAEATRDIEVQTDPQGPLHGPMYNSPADIPLPIPPRFAFVPPVGVGSSDLHPLGGGGGMIFQPPGMGPRPFMPDPFLPRGSVPPGARFDPIMPGYMPGTGRPRANPPRRYPDPDHLPPPGYDDMFS